MFVAAPNTPSPDKCEINIWWEWPVSVLVGVACEWVMRLSEFSLEMQCSGSVEEYEVRNECYDNSTNDQLLSYAQAYHPTGHISVNTFHHTQRNTSHLT